MAVSSDILQLLIEEKNPTKGIWISIVAYFFVALIGVFEKLLPTSIPIPVILFFQSSICFVLLIPEILWCKGVGGLKPRYLDVYLIRIASGIGCFGLLFYIVRFIPISEALVYQYSASLWIPLISSLWLNIPMKKKLWGGILVGFIGVLLILKPSGGYLGMVSLLGMLCGILQGLSVVGVRKLSLVEPTKRMLFYYFLVGVLLSGPLAAAWWVPLSKIDYLLLCGVGFVTYLSQKLIVLSLQYASASRLAPICYSSILFSGLTAWYIWQELPSEQSMIGMMLVVLGCVLNLFARD